MNKQEKQLFDFLLFYKNVRVEYLNIAQYIWGGDAEYVHTFINSIHNLVFRLKAKLPDKYEIINHNSVGYMLQEKEL